MFNNGYSISFHGIFSRMDSQYNPQIILSMEYKMGNRKRMNKGHIMRPSWVWESNGNIMRIVIHLEYPLTSGKLT